MHHKHVPTLGPRYWTALVIVSIFGANLGDFSSHNLHLGHAWGLLPMAALLATVFFIERRDRSWTQAYYWLAIIVIRAAATNLGDLATSDLKLGRIWAAGVLVVLLVAVVALGRVATGGDSDAAIDGKDPNTLPTTDAKYWTAMLIAGTLGTVLGDFTSFGLGLGTRYASLALSGLLAVVFAAGNQGLFARVGYYWFTIVMIRTTGTAIGDYLAGREVGMGLPISTITTGLIFAATLWLWKDEGFRRLRAS